VVYSLYSYIIIALYSRDLRNLRIDNISLRWGHEGRVSPRTTLVRNAPTHSVTRIVIGARSRNIQ